MIAQAVRHEQGRERLGQARQVLRHVHQCHGEVACGVQDRQAKRAHQHHVPCRRSCVLPKHNTPSQQSDDQNDRYDRMEEAQLFQIKKAASPRSHFPVDRGIQPPMFATDSAK